MSTSVPFNETNGTATVTIPFPNAGTFPIQAQIGSVLSTPFNEIVAPVVTALSLFVGPAAAPTTLNITAPATVTFSGIVTGSSGPIAGFKPFIFESNLSKGQTVNPSDVNGRFVFQLVFSSSTGSPFSIDVSSNANNT